MNELRELIISCRFPLEDNIDYEKGKNMLEIDIKDLIKVLTDKYHILKKSETSVMGNRTSPCRVCKIKDKCRLGGDIKCPKGTAYFVEDKNENKQD